MGERLTGAVVLLTGAGGGIGSALTAALLDAGVAEIISVGREHPPARERLRHETVDITDAQAVQALAERCAGRVTVVIACAGVNANQRLFTPGFEAAARREIDVNYFGLLNVASTFAPAMQARSSGLFVHLLTLLSHVNLPLMAGYCASKAAAHSLTQALRAELGRSGVRVCGVYPAVVDTAMSREIPGPKLAPAELAQAILQAIESGAEDVYPGPAAAAYQQFMLDPKSAERRMAARLA
jgi:short-subunit dehydrogenase